MGQQTKEHVMSLHNEFRLLLNEEYDILKKNDCLRDQIKQIDAEINALRKRHIATIKSITLIRF